MYCTSLHLPTYYSHEVRSICHLMYRIIVQFGFLNKTVEHISFYGILEDDYNPQSAVPEKEFTDIGSCRNYRYGVLESS